VIFQLALALGAPWGEMAMGGKFPGRFPPKMRVAAIVQLVLLLLMAFIVVVRAELVSDEYFEISRFAVWFVVTLSVVSSILNIITPSKKERMMWAPIAVILLICSLIVARS
jgi:cytochrome bd-type quinol oxidase subunit 2